MNRERAKELLPIIQAFAEGKTIQYQGNLSDTWSSDVITLFAGNGKYRIKPEPEVIYVATRNGEYLGVYKNIAAAPCGVGLKEFIEVIDDE